MTVSVVKLTDAIGAEIRGLDLSRPIDDADFAKAREAFYQHSVIVVRDHAFSDEDHIRFTARFGELKHLPLKQFLLGSHPEIFVVSNIKKEGSYIGAHDAGVVWHSDGPFLDKPHGPAALHALIVPKKDGKSLGDTRFASTIAAYDALPESRKKQFEGLRAVHSLNRRFKIGQNLGVSNSKVLTQGGDDTHAIHPLVQVHPHSGRKCLYVSEGYTTKIVGMPDDEAVPLIAELAAHCVKPEFQYVHSWREHDLVMWDNVSTQHKAAFDYEPQHRLMHRTTLLNP